MEYHLRLLALEDDVLRAGRQAQELIRPATTAMLDGDPRAVDQIATRDDQIDLAVHHVLDEVHDVLLTETPAASDLRLLLAAMYAARNVMRVGDYSLNIARLSRHLHPQDQDPDLRAQMVELSLSTERAVRTALDCLGRRDPDGLDALDDVEASVDLLSDGLIRRLMTYAATGPNEATWSIQMIQAAKHMERISDHAVALAEQGVYVATGERRLPRKLR